EATLVEIAEAKVTIESEIQSRSRRSEELRTETETLQRDLAGLQSQLAVLHERRSTVTRELTMLSQQAADLEIRAKEADAQIQHSGEQQEQTRATIQSLEVTRSGLIEERDQLDTALGHHSMTL